MREEALPVEGSDHAHASMSFSFSLKEVLWIATIAVLWAWTFLVFFSDVNLLSLSSSLKIEPVFRSVGLFAVAATFFAIAAHCQRKKPQHRVLSALVALLAPWTTVLALFVREISTFVFGLDIVAWALFGIADASLMFLARPRRHGISLKFVMLSIGLAFSVGALIYFAVSLAPRPVALVVLICLPYVSLACALANQPHIERACEQQEAQAPAKPSFEKEESPLWAQYAESFKTQPSQLIYGIIFGIAMGVGISTSIALSDTFPIGISLAFCFVGPFGMVLAIYLDQFTLEKVTWYLMPIAICGLLMITLGLQPVYLFCCALLAFCFNTHELVHTVSIVELMRDDEVDSASSFAVGKTLVYLGNAIGWAIACFIHRSATFNSWQFSAILLVVSAVAMFSMCILGRPWVHRSEGGILMPPPREPSVSYETIIAQIAAEAELTARQTEVFEFLCRGRNAPYICDKLVLSYHTVKAHIYRIYRKLDVHTQQELIDMVEQRRQT